MSEEMTTLKTSPKLAEKATAKQEPVTDAADGVAEKADVEPIKVMQTKTVDLPCRLTHDQVRERGKSLAQAQDKLRSHRAHEDDVKTKLKSTRVEIETEMQRLGAAIRNEQESKPVMVEVIGDFRRNVVIERRTDTGEQINERIMFPHEIDRAQGEMFPNNGGGDSDLSDMEKLSDDEVREAAALLVEKQKAGKKLTMDEVNMMEEAEFRDVLPDDGPSEATLRERAEDETEAFEALVQSAVVETVIASSGAKNADADLEAQANKAEAFVASMGKKAPAPDLMPPDDDDPMVPAEGALSVACPKDACRAPAGEWCMTPTGKRATKLHRVRVFFADTAETS